MSVQIPPPPIIRALFPQLVDFITRVGAARVTPDLYLTSWYRDRERNIRVGGHPQSQHRLGLAIDVGGPMRDLELWLEEVRSVGLIGIDEGSHVHVQLLPAGQAGQRFPHLFA